MHAALTDAMTCPRCGPDWGLILLADRVEDRRILDGWLGCPNCRERFRVQNGFGDLRFGAQPSAAEAASGPEEGEKAEPGDAARLAALMGVTQGPALLLVAGPGAARAGAIAALVEGAEVVGVWAGLQSEPEGEGVSRFAATGNLPFRSASMRAVALTDAVTAGLIDEAARVAGPRARVVVHGSNEQVENRLKRARLRVLAKDEHTIVAERVLF